MEDEVMIEDLPDPEPYFLRNSREESKKEEVPVEPSPRAIGIRSDARMKEIAHTKGHEDLSNRGLTDSTSLLLIFSLFAACSLESDYWDAKFAKRKSKKELEQGQNVNKTQVSSPRTSVSSSLVDGVHRERKLKK